MLDGIGRKFVQNKGKRLNPRAWHEHLGGPLSIVTTRP